MVFLKRGLMVAFLLAEGAAASSALSGWNEFHSPKGFSVLYPVTWFQQNVSSDRLDILSSKGHWEGVVIEKDEAYVFVKEEPRSSTKTLAEVVADYTQGTASLSSEDILGTGRGSCDILREVVWKEPPVPPQDVPPDMRSRVTSFVYTGLFCRIGSRDIVVILKNWQGDHHQTNYQRIALRMARSIRISGGES